MADLPNKFCVIAALLFGDSNDFEGLLPDALPVGAVIRAESLLKVTFLPVGDRYRRGESDFGFLVTFILEIDG